MTSDSQATTTTHGGPALEQVRRLVTEIPGPESRARLERKRAHVADGVGTMLPVFVVAAGGGVLRDVDGNQLIDLGSGIAVTSVGNAAPSVVRRVQEQVAAFTHTCFMITPYDGYVDVCAALGELTPGDHAKKPRCSTPARRRWRTRSRSPGSPRAATRSRCSTTPTTAGPTSRWR